jgi:hypothetical protein
MGLSAVIASPNARGATRINGQLVEETGPTSVLGGGDHVFVRFGSDAAFGVVYGTTANPNNVYIVAIKARYLGVAQVLDPQDRVIGQNRPVKIYTLHAVKLDSLVEFRDRDLNGVADYGRLYNTTTNQFSDYFNRGDTLYKKVGLHTNWTADPIVRSNGTGYRTWTFNLTAQNLSYTAVANYTGSLAGATPSVRFTFHLNASLEEIDDATVPQWRVTVDSSGGRSVVTNISRMTDLVVSGKAAYYDLKWDQDVSGWTYALPNFPLNQRRILLELGAIVGNWIPAAIVDAWFETRVLDRIGETGSARFNSTAGVERANDTTGTYPAVRALQSPSVDFDGNWTRIARLVWVGDAVVDGGTSPVYGQIVAGVRFIAIGESGNAFLGFALLAGLSFEGGASIIHDPNVTTDVQADLLLPGTTVPGGALVVAVVASVIVIVGLLLLGLLVSRRKKRELDPPPPPPQSSLPPPPED